MPHLLFARQEEKLMEYRLQTGRTSIGRADFCDIALPGEEISRTHCIVQGHGQQWTLVDRSRHGTTLNGQKIQRVDLNDGDSIRIGQFEATFRLDGVGVSASTADVQPARLHEQLLDTADQMLRVQQVGLDVLDGPDAGQRLTARRSRMTLGSSGSDLVLSDASVVAEHCSLRIAHGRVMVEPGRGPVWLDGHRLRQITPLYPEETFQIGESTLRLTLGEARLSPEADRFGEMVGQGPSMRRLFGTLRVLAGHDEPLLLIGESGTGKELAARGVHDHSPRAGRAFVSLNCGGLSQQLLQSELFGYEKGAFTGASQRRDGAFQQADGGTLFLDELGELPLDAQATLLRALGGGGVRRVGGFQTEYPDVRVIAATNRDLVAMIREGTFRKDLFFRLETLFVNLPPLRQRTEDVEMLALGFARQLDPQATVTPAALSVLQQHSWPGNVRELANVVRRAVIRHGARIEPKHLIFHAISTTPSQPVRSTTSGSPPPQHSRDYLHTLLQQHGNNRAAVARALGISRSTLLYRLKKVGLSG